MLGRVIDYLHSHGVSFRLSSRPSPEPLPAVAQSLPPGSLLLETQLLRIGGRPAIACIPQGTTLSIPRLRHELGAAVTEAELRDLPAPYSAAEGLLPPLGGELGALTVIDERVAIASSLAFPVFSRTDLIEVPYDDFARLEQPRIASIAGGGELPEASQAGEPERRSA